MGRRIERAEQPREDVEVLTAAPDVWLAVTKDDRLLVFRREAAQRQVVVSCDISPEDAGFLRELLGRG